MIFGHARVSTNEQNLDVQIDALTDADVEKIFKEEVTGSTRQRPQLEKLLEQVRKDDVVMAGKQPVELTAKRLNRLGELPISWAEQRRVLGFV